MTAYIGTLEFLSVAEAIDAAKPGDVIWVSNIDAVTQGVIIRDEEKSPPGALQG